MILTNNSKPCLDQMIDLTTKLTNLKYYTSPSS
ncbi:unnamed protein product, partial [Adineta steineri]